MNDDQQQHGIPMMQYLVLGTCAGWIAVQVRSIVFEGGDGNGILLLPAMVLLVHMGSILHSGHRRAVRLDALALGVMFLAGTMRDVVRIAAYDVGTEIMPLVWLELGVGVLLLAVWRWTR